MNVALHNLKAALINGRANKAIEVEQTRKTLAVLEGQYHLFTDLLDRAVKEEEDEKKRLEKREVKTDGQRSDEFDKMRGTLEACYEYLGSILPPCDVLCDCIIHDLEAVLGKESTKGK